MTKQTPSTLPAKADPNSEEFDPESVPRYPVITVNLHNPKNTGEPESADVDGERITASDGETLTQATVRVAARHASQQRTALIRVNGRTPDGQVFPFVVHADGRRWDLQPKETKAAKPTTPKWLWPLVATASGIALATAVVLALLPAPVDEDQEQAGPPPPISTPTELPTAPPPGWSPHAKWSTSIDNDHKPLTLNENTFALVNGGQVTALNAENGATVWTQPLPRGKARTGVERTRITGTGVLALWHDKGILLLTESGSQEPTLIPVPEGTKKVSFDSERPLIHLDPRHAATIDRKGQTLTRVIPHDATAVGARANTDITSVTKTALYYRTNDPNTAPDPTALTAPSPGATPIGVTGYTGHFLLYTWATAEQTPITVVYDDSQDTMPILTAITHQKNTQPTWHPSPEGNWGMIGKTLLDITGKTATPIPNWARTTTVTSNHAYGTTSETPTRLNRQGEVSTTDLKTRSTAPPQAETTTILLTTTNTPTGRTLYALKQD